MIYTITLNPALDISGTVDSLIPDEKSYVYNETHSPGGNGINASLIMHELKTEVLNSGFLGGPNGKELAQLLEARKVKHSFIKISGSTRMNLTVSTKRTHRQTRLSFPGPQIKPSEFKALQNFLLKKRDKKIVVLGGSLPPGIKPAHISQLVKKLNQKNSLCIVDMPGNILKGLIDARPFFIKPNLIEFQQLVGKKVTTIKTILPLARKLNRWVPLICISSVEGGALLISQNEAYFGKIPKVKVYSTVGAGDSMVGAITAKYSENPASPLGELLRWGLAAACATLTEEGMKLGSKKSILKYYPKIDIRKIE